MLASVVVGRRSLITLVFLLAACSGDSDPGGSGTKDQLMPTFGSDGPLHGIFLVAETKADGSHGDPRFSFTTANTELTAIVGLGSEGLEEGGPPLKVDWYVWQGIGKREHLFSQSIEVGPGGHAFSQAVSPTGIAPGVYETVATLGERRVSSPWVVEVASAAAPAGLGGAAFALLSPLAQVGDEDWNVPYSGDSGWNTPEESPGPGAEAGPCDARGVDTGFSPSTVVKGSGFFVGMCTHVTISASMSGAPVELGSLNPSQGAPTAFVQGESELCDLPGGSDLPGAVVTWRSSGDQGTSSSGTFTVPDFGELLVAMLLVTDGTPSRVEPGTRIAVRGMSYNTMPSLGVEKLDVYAGDQLLNTAKNLSGSGEPQPCDVGRLAAINDTSYTVPNNPPPIIEICAKGTGFDGTEASHCEAFYTGEVWEGTVDSAVTIVGPAAGHNPCGDPHYVRGTARIVVAEDGSAIGTYDVTGCNVSQPHAEYTGTASEDGFSFPELIVFTNGEPIPKVSPTEARATLTNCQCVGGAGARWVTTWNLTCKTCEE